MNTITILGIASMLFVIWFTWHEARKKETGAGQSKRAALFEAWTNIVIGFTINFVANLWIIPLMVNADLPHSMNWWGGWIYTVISIVRQYVIRRFFNKHLQRLNVWLAAR